MIIHDFMFSPEWEKGCVGCSLHSDHNLMDWVRHHDKYPEGFVDVMSLYQTGKVSYEAGA